jgi:hypothetical protein
MGLKRLISSSETICLGDLSTSALMESRESRESVTCRPHFRSQCLSFDISQMLARYICDWASFCCIYVRLSPTLNMPCSSNLKLYINQFSFFFSFLICLDNVGPFQF